ncbi:FAD-dependent oxidoreductase domain-containing protein 2 [Macrotis lagotis]|uniref:FAD-dependent oxidoreductase domain-containing protein 2 n=1 Tax=Macrotis lagotis TaxID=92651 RepID=UPI003D68AA59
MGRRVPPRVAAPSPGQGPRPPPSAPPSPAMAPLRASVRLLLTLALPAALGLGPFPQGGPSPRRDYCVLGAGPAGLQMAQLLGQAGRDYVVLERAAAPGSFFTRYPRHRKLISINKRFTGKVNGEFNLRHDWNSLLSPEPGLLFRHYSRAYFPQADDMVRYLGDFAGRLRLRVLYNTAVVHVALRPSPRAWNGHVFVLTDQRGRHYQCSVLLVATGVSVPNEIDFPGSEYVEGYESVSVNPEDFVGQNVLILGRGNSAFETAENILGYTNFIHMIGRSRIRLSWATHYVGDLRAVNNGLLDTYQLKSLDGLIETDLKDLAIVKDSKGRLHVTLRILMDKANQNPNATAETISLPQDEVDNFALRVPYDRVIRCLGFTFDFSIFNSTLGLAPGKGQKKKYPLIKASYESKRTRGLFVLGTASHSVDYRKSAGGFIHGFRYTARAIHRLLEHRHHGIPWPSPVYPITQLTNTIIRRVNEASGLYQMFSVLADIILLKENATGFEYLEEYPLRMLAELETLTGREAQHGLFVVTMEYGKNFSGPDKDVFYYDRAVGDVEDAWQSNFLHPVIYFYHCLPTEKEMASRAPDWPLPRPVAIHHIVEDFLTDWTAPNSHILPLRRFLENCLNSDLRSFYAESCFFFALTRQKLPPFCQHGYMNMRGLVGNERLRKHGIESGLMEDYTAIKEQPVAQKPGDPGIPVPSSQHDTSTKEEL